MINAITICNTALQYIGLKAINSFQDASKEAQLLYSLYPITRNELLERFDFSFSTAIEYLPKIAQNSVQQQRHYYHTFQLPRYCLRVRNILNTNDYYFAQNRTVLSSANTLLAAMTRIVEDANTFSSLFIEALTYKLSTTMATALLGNADLADSFYKRYLYAFEEAQKMDSTTLERERTLLLENTP